MKTRFINIRGAASRAFVCSLALLALLAFVLPQAVQASTAAYTVISNTATVDYDDTAGNPMPQASSNTLNISVAFVCGQPVLSAPGDGSTDPNTNEVYTYTITSAANGPDTYDLSAAVTGQSAGITGSTAAPSVASVTLGGTTAAVAAAIGATSLTVPNDTASNSSVNGIEDGDIIVIGGLVYKVSTVTDNGGTVGGTSIINLDTTTINPDTGLAYTALTAAVPAGTLINERQSFTVTVDPGTVSAASDQTIDVTVTADGQTGSCAVDTDDTQTTVNVASLTMLKEVSADGSTWVSTNDQTFVPGATVWYRLTVTNTGSSNATSVTVTDPVPAYTTYVHESTRLNGITVANDGPADPSPLIAGLVVDDNGSRAAGAVASGTLPPYSAGPPVVGRAIVIYQVTVN